MFSRTLRLWECVDRRNGHACCLQYILLHLFGYDLPMSELERFRQLGSHTPGHPEANHGTPGIEVTTGPLGQGNFELFLDLLQALGML